VGGVGGGGGPPAPGGGPQPRHPIVRVLEQSTVGGFVL
jgi:hypothetical protein